MEGVVKAVVNCLSEPPQVSGRDTIADQDTLFRCRRLVAEQVLKHAVFILPINLAHYLILYMN